MLEMTISHACTGCELCEVSMPGLRAEILKRGKLLLNPYNKNVNWEGITEALMACTDGAMDMRQCENET